MSIERVVELANVLKQQSKAVDDLNDQLKAAKASLFKTETEDLPALMSELGLSELALTDGTKVAVAEDVKCAITADKKDSAHQWLEKHGFGGLIKTTVQVDFAPESRDGAIELADELASRFDQIKANESVNAATLKSFIKEQLAQGNEIPFDLFSIFPFNRATIKKG